MKIRKYFKSFKSVLFINFVFFFLNLKKKTILFFHPVDDLRNIHDFYLQKTFKEAWKKFHNYKLSQKYKRFT